jgi:hypothetical protein
MIFSIKPRRKEKQHVATIIQSRKNEIKAFSGMVGLYRSSGSSRLSGNDELFE